MIRPWSPQAQPQQPPELPGDLKNIGQHILESGGSGGRQLPLIFVCDVGVAARKATNYLVKKVLVSDVIATSL